MRTIDDVTTDLRAYACHDGYCAVLKPTGMHTNGGCKCVRRMLDEGNAGRLRIEKVMRLHQERYALLEMNTREEAPPTADTIEHERLKERDQIVAWLRGQIGKNDGPVLLSVYAECIEFGAHRAKARAA